MKTNLCARNGQCFANSRRCTAEPDDSLGSIWERSGTQTCEPAPNNIIGVNYFDRPRTVEAWDDEGGLGPPGAVWLEDEQAWNFTLYSRHARGVTLLLYGANDFREPVFQLELNPLKNKTARVWHCRVRQQLAPEARYYAYRVQGPWNPRAGHRFNADKVLFDPYAEELFFPPEFSREAARQPGRNDGRAVLGVLPRIEQPFDWGDTAPPRHTHDSIVYELHVKGFTARANSGVTDERRGTFPGVVEKIPYLKELGITVV